MKGKWNGHKSLGSKISKKAIVSRTPKQRTRKILSDETSKKKEEIVKDHKQLNEIY